MPRGHSKEWPRQVSINVASLSQRIGRTLEEGQQFMRFDCNARAEVFVTQDELEDACWYGKIDGKRIDLRTDPRPEAEKIKLAHGIALQLASARVSAIGNGVEVTADISLESVNINKIDWVALVTPKREDEDSN